MPYQALVNRCLWLTRSGERVEPVQGKVPTKSLLDGLPAARVLPGLFLSLEAFNALEENGAKGQCGMTCATQTHPLPWQSRGWRVQYGTACCGPGHPGSPIGLQAGAETVKHNKQAWHWDYLSPTHPQTPSSTGRDLLLGRKQTFSDQGYHGSLGMS